MTNLEFKKLLGNSLPGTKIVYHVGLLMFDRLKSKELNTLAMAVWASAGMRWVVNARPSAEPEHTDQWQPTGERRVILTQRKLSEPLGYEYIAIKI